jgi:cellobiose-specific phosphotransferase system component IIB
MNKIEQAELDEARARLERNKALMLKQYTAAESDPELDALLEDADVLLCGPQTELSCRRMLRDIKASGYGD